MAGGPVSDWLSLPPGAFWDAPGNHLRFAVGPAGAGVAVTLEREPGAMARLAARLGFLPPPPPRVKSAGVFWADPAAAGTVRELRRFPGAKWDVNLVPLPDSVAAFAVDRDTGSMTVEVWPAAPPPDPWPPAVAAGVLVGAIAAWRFGRRRKRVENAAAHAARGRVRRGRRGSAVDRRDECRRVRRHR